ncbi:MAG: hypothetical protein AAB538_01315 [Patescibacteria group bacterium]
MKRVAGPDEDEAIVAVPDVVGVAIGVVEPQAVVVVFDVEHVEPVVRVADFVECAIYATAPRSFSSDLKAVSYPAS